MKTLIAATALATVLAMPAMAQEIQQSKLLQRPDQVRQQAVRPAHPQRHSPNAAYDVYAPDGRYVGSDPDVSIRSKLWFDAALEGND